MWRQMAALRRQIVTFAILIATLIIVAGAPAIAASEKTSETPGYPTRPIRIVVPFSPGGVADITARLIGQKLTESLGQPVVVENRPGAGGVLGTEVVAKAAPDGYTLLSVAANHAAVPAVRAKPPYDTLKDFSGIALTSSGAYALIVASSSEIKTIKDLIALAKSKPGQLNFSSAGFGSGTHFAGELFKMRADIDVIHVPYKGIPEALTDTIAGRVDFFMPSLSSVTGVIGDGTVRALAVTSKERVASLPNVPTLAESGVPDFEWNAWTALLAPANTPHGIIEQLHREVVRILELPDVKQRMVAIGADAVSISPKELDKRIADEVTLTIELGRKAGIKPQ